jgi:predicted permease
MTAPLAPWLAVLVGGVAGVAGGAAFFMSGRQLAQRIAARGQGRRRLAAGLAWRLTLVAVALALVAWLGGMAGTLALLVGVGLARLVVRRV